MLLHLAYGSHLAWSSSLGNKEINHLQVLLLLLLLSVFLKQDCTNQITAAQWASFNVKKVLKIIAFLTLFEMCGIEEN